MTITLAMQNALSGLRVAQSAVATTSHNMSNAQTVGFTRKSLPQEAVIIGGQGAGVRASEVIRTVDQQLQRDVWRQISLTTNLKTREDFLVKVEQLNGRPEDETSLSANLAALRKGFERLSATPESRTLQIDTLTQAESLARQFNRMADQYQALRNDTQVGIAQGISELNNNITRITELNQAIIRATQTGRSTADLQDQRDVAIRALSELVDISIAQVADNGIVILTRSGQTLVGQNPTSFHFTPSALTDESFYRLSPPGTIQPIRVGDPISGSDVTIHLQGGRLGALIELRDRTIPQLSAELDEAAHKMALRFQAQTMTLFTGRNGQTVPANTLGGYVGFARDIRLSLAAEGAEFIRYGDNGVPTTPPNLTVSNGVIERVLNFTFGDTANSNNDAHAAFRVANLGPDPLAQLQSDLPTVASLELFVQSLISGQGLARAQIETRRQESQELRDALDTRLSNESGVNIDQELAQLTILQRSYGASAQVLRTVQTMLDETLAILR